MEGNNGWTLVLKASGKNGRWHYDSGTWKDQSEYQGINHKTGLDFSEVKSPEFWKMNFRYLRLGV